MTKISDKLWEQVSLGPLSCVPCILRITEILLAVESFPNQCSIRNGSLRLPRERLPGLTRAEALLADNDFPF